MTVGLAEVEERLRAVTRRVNTVTLLHLSFLAAAAAMVVCAALVAVAVRATAVAFGLSLWVACAILLAGGAAVAMHGRRRWLGRVSAAHLIDRRADLADRLATVVALRAGTRPSRLTPVLVAQLLALGPRWQAERIAPRRVPRSAAAPVAALAALAAALLLARRQAAPIPAAAAPPRVIDAVAAAAAAPEEASAQHNAPETTDLLVAPAPPAVAGASTAGEFAAHGGADAPRPATAGREEGSLAERLRQAIRSAVHADPEAEAQQPLLARAVGARRSSDESAEHHADGAGEPRGGRPSSAAAAAGDKDNGSGRPGQRPGQPAAGQQPGHPRDSGQAERKFEGASPGAGSGSSPGSLMAAQATGPALDQQTPATFKLAIASVLRAVEAHGPRQQPAHKGTAGAGAVPAGAETSAVPPSGHELRDDALLKTEVPVEYEDLVRRVYSQRNSR